MTEIILTSSVLILLLAALRWILKGKINPMAQYALWLLAAARLLIPGTLFAAPVTVMGAAEELQAIQAMDQAASRGAVPGNPSGFHPPEQPDGPSAYFEAGPAGETPGRPAAYPDSAPAVPPKAAHTAGYWAELVWKAGAAVTGGAMLASNLVFCFRLRKRRRRLCLPERYGTMPVYEVDGIPSPCLFGLFRPAVYLSGDAASSPCLDHILTHEYTHCRHGDHIWAVLRGVCLAVHWYNPLVWWACALSRRDCELACDEASIRRLGESQRIDYGQTLLRMVRRRPAPGDFLCAATTMTAGKRAMQERIALIARQPKTRKITIAAVLLAVCLLVSCTFGGREKAPPDDAISELLEFPGVQWNDSVEAVIEKLHITEEQFVETVEDPADGRHDSWQFILADYPLLGGTAQYASFTFIQYTEGGEMGLSNVALYYPDGMEDFGAVCDALEAKCGPGTDSTKTPQASETWQNLLGDRYGRWVELAQMPGTHTMEWVRSAYDVPERYADKLAAIYAEQSALRAQRDGGIPAPWHSLEEYMEDMPMARLSWTDRAVFSPTFNVVTFNGDLYVMLTQMMASDGSAAGIAPVEPDPRSEALARLDALRDADVIGYSTSGKSGAPASAGLSAASIPVLEEAFRACLWFRADAPAGGEPPCWERTSIGGFTFYDGSPLVSYASGGGTDWYSVPEGWLTVKAALEYADSHSHSIVEKKGLYLYHHARATWDMFWFDRLPVRYDGLMQEENGLAWLPVGFYEGVADLQGHLQTVFAPDIVDYLMGREQFMESGGQLYVYGPAAPPPNAPQPSQYAAGETAPQVFTYTAGDAAQYEYDGHVFVQTPVLDHDLATVLGYKRHDYYYKWNGTHYVFTNFSPFDDVDPQMYYDAADIVRQCQQDADPGQWIYLLDYMDWQAVEKAAGSYSSSAMEVVSALQNYAASRGASLTAAEMTSMLTATDGLDGALSENYQVLVYQLYEANPARFAQIVLNELPQPQKSAVLDYFRWEWTYHQDAYKDFMDREGITEILARELAAAPESTSVPQ